MKNNLNYAVELIRKSDGILITAGAGMSVDSGLPDFRSSGGFWNAYPAFREHNLNFQDIATPMSFETHTELIYWFYGHRLVQYRNTTSHEGYQILKRWASEKPHGYFVFTSNVDGHFQKAGFEEKRVYEVHGTLERMQCVHDCHHQSWTAKDFQPEVDNVNLRLTSPYPRCPFCGGLARQNVLMFDDWFYNSNYQDLKRTSLEQWIKGVPNLVVIELGAGKAIPTVRYFSERAAKAKKAGFIRINPQDGGVSKHHFLGLDMTALEALKAIDTLLKQSA